MDYLLRKWSRMNKRVEKENNQCFNKGCKFKRSKTSVNKYNNYMRKAKFASLNWNRIEMSGRKRVEFSDGIYVTKK